MSIGNIGGGGKDPFMPPEESEEKNIEDNKERKSFSGHDIDVPDKNIEDKTSKLTRSLPDLSEKMRDNSQRNRSLSDSELEKEPIYDVPRSFITAEPIYDVPKGVGGKKGTSDVSKSSQERNDDVSQSTEKKIGQAARFLSPDPTIGEESIYDFPTLPGESGFVLAEEPIYENVDVLLTQLGLFSDFEEEQQRVLNEFIDRVNRSAAECTNTCETLLEDSTQTQKDDSIRNKFLKVISSINITCEKIATKLSELKLEFIEGWRKQFSIKAASPTEVYYKQTTSSVSRERFKVFSASLSAEAKQKLQEIAKKQKLDIQFLVSGDETLIVMTTPETQTPFQKVQEKISGLLSSFRSLYQTKATSDSQPKNLETVSEVFLSLLKLLTSFSQKVTDLAQQQKYFLERVMDPQAQTGFYSLEGGKSLSETRKGRYKKTTGDEEEDTRL